jgi:hypothetical protein
MDSSDVIFIDDFPTSVYHDIIWESAKYAIISLPFTYARIPGADVSLRVNRILKGKVAEKVIQEFLKVNDVAVEVDKCTTDFWEIDQRDFLFDNLEWDVKNNYLHRKLTDKKDFLDVPALVPLGAGQWGTRDRLYFPSKGAGYVFTFCEDDKWKVSLSPQQQHHLAVLDRRFRSGEAEAPFGQEEFWNAFKGLGEWAVNSDHQPRFALTGYASKDEWGLFQEVGEHEFHVANQRVFVTKIRNMHVPVGQLPSIRERFSLDGNLNYSKG